MGRTPHGKSDSMDWVTMKNYRHKCRQHIDLLEVKILTIATEHKARVFETQKSMTLKNVYSTVLSQGTLSTSA